MVSILAIVILGGKRTFLGPIIGSIIFISLPQIFSNIREYRMIIVGFIILLCIIFLKNGIVPTVSRFFENKVLERKIRKNGNSWPLSTLDITSIASTNIEREIITQLRSKYLNWIS